MGKHKHRKYDENYNEFDGAKNTVNNLLGSLGNIDLEKVISLVNSLSSSGVLDKLLGTNFNKINSAQNVNGENIQNNIVNKENYEKNYLQETDVNMDELVSQANEILEENNGDAVLSILSYLRENVEPEKANKMGKLIETYTNELE